MTDSKIIISDAKADAKEVAKKQPEFAFVATLAGDDYELIPMGEAKESKRKIILGVLHESLSKIVTGFNTNDPGLISRVFNNAVPGEHFSKPVSDLCKKHPHCVQDTKTQDLYSILIRDKEVYPEHFKYIPLFDLKGKFRERIKNILTLQINKDLKEYVIDKVPERYTVKSMETLAYTVKKFQTDGHQFVHDSKGQLRPWVFKLIQKEFKDQKVEKSLDEINQKIQEMGIETIRNQMVVTLSMNLSSAFTESHCDLGATLFMYQSQVENYLTSSVSDVKKKLSDEKTELDPDFRKAISPLCQHGEKLIIEIGSNPGTNPGILSGILEKAYELIEAKQKVDSLKLLIKLANVIYSLNHHSAEYEQATLFLMEKYLQFKDPKSGYHHHSLEHTLDYFYDYQNAILELENLDKDCVVVQSKSLLLHKAALQITKLLTNDKADFTNVNQEIMQSSLLVKELIKLKKSSNIISAENPITETGKAVYKEADRHICELLKKEKQDRIYNRRVIDSLKTASNILKTPSMKDVKELNKQAQQVEGHSNCCKKFWGVLGVLAGITSIVLGAVAVGLGFATAIPTFGLSLATFTLAGKIMVGSGAGLCVASAGLFKSDIQKGYSKSLSNLTKAVEKENKPSDEKVDSLTTSLLNPATNKAF